MAATVLGATMVLANASGARAGELPAPSDYFIAPLVHAHQRLLLTIRFDAPPQAASGDADLLSINLGAFGTQVSVLTNLYVDGTLLGTASHTGGGLFAIFKTPSSLYTQLGPPVTVSENALNSLFNGSSKGVLEVLPTFSTTEGYVGYSGWGPHAGRSFSATGFTDIYPIATIESVHVVAEPRSGMLFLAAMFGLGAISFRARHRSQLLGHVNGLKRVWAHRRLVPAKPIDTSLR